MKHVITFALSVIVLAVIFVWCAPEVEFYWGLDLGCNRFTTGMVMVGALAVFVVSVVYLFIKKKMSAKAPDLARNSKFARFISLVPAISAAVCCVFDLARNSKFARFISLVPAISAAVFCVFVYVLCCGNKYEKHMDNYLLWVSSTGDHLCDKHGNVIIKGRQKAQWTTYRLVKNVDNDEEVILKKESMNHEDKCSVFFFATYDLEGNKLKEIKVKYTYAKDDEYGTLREMLDSYLGIESDYDYEHINIESIEQVYPKDHNDGNTSRGSSDTSHETVSHDNSYDDSYHNSSTSNDHHTSVDDGPEYVMEEVWVDCLSCNGSGRCTACHGEGWDVYGQTNNYSGQYSECVVCHGSGKCTACYGMRGQKQLQSRRVR